MSFILRREMLSVSVKLKDMSIHGVTVDYSFGSSQYIYVRTYRPSCIFIL